MTTPSALPSPFMLAYGNRVMTATGTLEQVTEETALAVARAKGSAVIGAIPFDPAQPAYLAVPDALASTEEAPASVHTQPAPAHLDGLDNPGFRQAVGTAIAAMNRGDYEKVVLARLLTASYSTPLNLPGLYSTLRVQQPRATVFSLALPGGDYLMGASPELVFKTTPEGFATGPLAGSASRTEPAGSTEDTQIGEALLRSPKDRAEHATVVDDIRARLEPITTALNVPATPSLKATPQLWHLGTDITGQLQDGLTSLDGARAIHPTPAICGTPTELTRRVIDELEPFERGYFGGLVGYMDADGYGEWYLTLRCAQVNEKKAVLFAGAGIVKNSTPAGEHAETAAKLGTFARALGLNLN